MVLQDTHIITYRQGEEASRCQVNGPPLALQLNKWKGPIVKVGLSDSPDAWEYFRVQAEVGWV